MMHHFSRWTRLSPFDYWFSLYVGGAAAVLVTLTSWFVPEVESRCAKVADRSVVYGCNFHLSLNENWLYWAAFFAIPVAALFLAYRIILVRLRLFGWIPGPDPLISGIVTTSLFLMASLVTIPIAGLPGVLGLTYHSWIVYALVLGLIDAFSGISPDLRFVSCKEYHVPAKIARLQQEHQKWGSTLVIVTAFYLAIAISGIITVVIGVNEILRAPWISMAFLFLLYGSIGIGFGVYRNLFQKIGLVNRATLEVKEPNDC